MMLGAFGGFMVGDTKFFYIRGAESVDKQWRVEGVSWWKEEELSYRQAKDAIELYASYKPDIMLTHDCPSSALLFFITNPLKDEISITNNILHECFKIHKPKNWYFGHHHIDKEVEYKGTKFRCINELSYVDLDIKNGEINGI